MKRQTSMRAATLVAALVFLAAGALPGDEAADANGPTALTTERLPMIGMAKIDLTPDVKTSRVRLNGYADRKRRPAIGVHDPLHARALVGVDPAGRRFAVVSLDLCLISEELRRRVLELVGPYGFDDHNLLLSATHTHSGFAGYEGSAISWLLMGPFDKQILEDAAQRTAAAILQAQTNLRPVHWERATVRLADMNRSRLDPAFVMNEVKGPGDQAVYDHAKYPTNENLTAFRFTTDDGKVVGAVIHFAAHPTILSPKNMELSADFPGVLCDRLERHLGEGSVCLFLNATLGDTAPTPDWVDDLAEEYEMMNDYGNELADRVIEALAELKPIGEPEVVAHSERRIFDHVTLRQLYRWKLPTYLSRLFTTNLSVPLQAVRLGDVVLLAVPGEPTTKVGEHIKAACPEGMQCLIVAPANRYLGYFVTAEEYEGGTYAADSCFFGPDGVARMEEGVQAALARVAP